LRSRWQIERDPIDLAGVLAAALRDGDVERTLRGLDPDHPQFAALLDALRRYREIAAAGGWPVVPRGEVIGEGDVADAARLRALAQRLHAEGFLAAIPAEYQGTAEATAASSLPYSAALAEAVRAFQRTRTLAPDGRLGPETQAELAVSVEERLRQIALNLERWRWVPDDFGATTVLVNIPGYTLDVEVDRTVVESMAVVVGGKGWETPVFGDEIEHLVLNPYWNVPPRILAEEVLPSIQADPGYLARHDMEVVRGESDAAAPVADPWLLGVDRGVRVRQRPGPRNPLGQVKFMFPNPHNVYLHDTSSRSSFARADRSASHGCIRVERPIELAELLLRRSSWSSERLRSTIAAGEPAQVPLPEKLPVYLLYFTASVRPDGALHFYEDVYGIDAAHRAARG
jgi:murein L,D-transpeptidase YcbB/YkuD